MKTKTFIGGATLDYPVGHNLPAVKEFIDRAIVVFEQIFKGNKRPVNIWCRGSSGSILATSFSLRTSRPARVLYVRKEEEQAHTGNGSLNPYGGAINIIIDDFVSSGETLESIWARMQEDVKTIDCIILQGPHFLPTAIKPRYLIHRA